MRYILSIFLLFTISPLIFFGQTNTTTLKNKNKPEAKNPKQENFSAYLFAYFTGNAKSEEAICFALSNDGYNYRALNAKGEYVTILQRFSYIPSNQVGIPSGVVGVAFNITHFKNDLSIVHTIEETIRYNTGIVNELLFKKVHPILEFPELRLISRRELDILKHMAAGFSSKQIADNLNISINTINNHRKSMLSKTRCSSSAELMNYAVKHGLL